MSKLRFALNRQGVRELMRSEEMKAILSDEAKRVRETCGDGFEQDLYVGRNRANAMVKAVSRSAKKRNLNENTLLKAVKR